MRSSKAGGRGLCYEKGGKGEDFVVAVYAVLGKESAESTRSVVGADILRQCGGGREEEEVRQRGLS
jgi:hypothetical protein